MRTRKRFTNPLAFVALALGIVALGAGRAGAEIIYSDSFGRTGTLHGSAPDTAPGSQTWSAHTNWTTDGAEAKHLAPSGLGNHAMLPFTPETGKIYRLKAEMDSNGVGPDRFVGIGFFPSLTLPDWPSTANPLLAESLNGWRATMPLGAGTAATRVATGTATAGVAELYAIELDTQNPLWTVSFFVHGNPTPVYSTTYTTNPTIGAVGIITWAPSYGGNASFVDNFELSDDATNSAPPTIVPPTDPANGASGVLVNADFVATFDENIALTGAGTVTIRDLGPGPDVVIDLSGPDPDGSVAVSGSVLTISPASNLVANNPYAIQISADAIEDLEVPPNAFAGILDDTTWSFQTAADGTPPTVVSTDPADDATGVATDTNLVATFDESIVAASGNITIRNLTEATATVIPVGDPRVSVSGSVLTIDPATDLVADADYAIRIDTGAVTDTTGNPFAGITGDTTWNFSSLADTTNPTLVLPTIPADDAINVTMSRLVATFSEPVMATAPTVLHHWDFDTDDGGFTLKSGGSGTEWARGTPDSVGEFGGSVTADNSGSGQCWATGLGDFTNDPTVTGRGYYADPTTTCLRSPVIDLTSVSSAELTFFEALDVEAGDTAVVRLIDDTSDTVIATVYNAVDGNTSAAAWAAANGGAAIDLAAGIGQLVRLEWCLGDPAIGGGTADYLGWYIDDVQVTAAAPGSSITIRNLTQSTETSIAASDSSQVSIVGNVLTVTPKPALDAETDYAIRIGAGALTDLYGNPFAGISNDTTWNFTSGAEVSYPIYSDTFSRSVSLDGSAPEVRPGSETWFAHSTWTTDGTQAKHLAAGGTNYGLHAMLPFTPEAGKIYTLKADINANAANAGWFVGIGFYPSLFINGWPENANPLLSESYNGWKAFMPLGNATSPVATGAATAGLAEVYAIELDTRNSPWTVSFYVHGNPTPVSSTTYTTNPTIGAVGIITWAPSYDGKAAFVDNFELFAVQPDTGGGNNFSDWIALYDVGSLTGLGDDPDGDGVANGVENFFGTLPDEFSQGLIAAASNPGAGTFTFTHPQGALADDLTAAYQWSKDLSTFHAGGASDGDGTSVNFNAVPDTPSPGITTVTATVTGAAAANLFVRVQVTQD